MGVLGHLGSVPPALGGDLNCSGKTRSNSFVESSLLPKRVVLAALLFGFLRSGATGMQSYAGVPIDIISIIQALVIIFVAAPAIVRSIYRIRFRRAVEAEVFTRGWGG